MYTNTIYHRHIIIEFTINKYVRRWRHTRSNNKNCLIIMDFFEIVLIGQFLVTDENPNESSTVYCFDGRIRITNSY